MKAFCRPHLLLVLCALLLFETGSGALRPAIADGPGWLDGWTYRIPITIDRTRVSGPLADFPVLLHLSASSGENSADISSIFSMLGQNGKRLAVTSSDGTTQLPVEIARWDAPGRQAYLWTKVPSLSNAASTYLYLYYDANQPDNTTFVGDTGSAAAESVWDSSFVGVWHLAQAGNGTAGEYKDSTSNHRDGQGGGGLGYGTPALTTTGAPMGAAQTFNGSNSYISIPDSDAFSVTTTGNLTVSAWISPATVDQPTATDGYTRWMGKSEDGENEWQFVYYNRSHPSRSQWISYYNYSHDSPTGLGAGDYSKGNFPENSWVYVTGNSQCNSSSQGIEYVLRNAAVHSGNPDSWQTYGVNYTNTAAPILIGTGRLSSGNWWSGRIGEIRISSTTRSNAWIAASYYAESDAFVSYGYLESNPATTKPPACATGEATGVTADHATLNGELIDLGTAGSVSVSFQYGTSADYGNTISGQPSSLGRAGTFQAAVSGLSPGATYHYKAVAVGDGRASGSDQTFTMLPSQGGPGPRVFGLDSGDAVYASTMLNAQRFENTAGTGALTRLDLLVSDPGAAGLVRLGVYADNNGVPGNLLLDAGTVMAANGWVGISELSLPVTSGAYYWLAYLPQNTLGVAYRSTGMSSNSHAYYSTVFSALPDQFSASELNSTPFVMRATVGTVSVAPSVSTAGVGDVTADGAALTGSLDALGSKGTALVNFEYGTSSAYGTKTDGQVLTASGSFIATIAGLKPGTTYHFRAVAVGDGTTFGEDRTFTTSPAPSTAPATTTVTAPTTTAQSTTSTPSTSTTPIGRTEERGTAWMWIPIVALILIGVAMVVVLLVRRANRRRGPP